MSALQYSIAAIAGLQLLLGPYMAIRDIIGQDKAVSILLGTIRRGRIPSAYLFAGESGIGKRFTALNLAKAINCLKADTTNSELLTPNSELLTQIDACDECRSCRKIDSGTHPDVIVIEPEKNEILVDEIRAVGDAISYKPFEGKRKVVIIDDADTMNQYAANAFLKTLEEPPGESILILVTANPDRLPETIRSRCSRINFVPLSDEVCKGVIQAVSSRQPIAHGQDSKRLEVIVRLSMGSPGLAISSDILKEREDFLTLLKNMLGGVSEPWADRDEMEQWFNLALVLVRDMAVLRITEDAVGQQGPVSCNGVLLNDDIRDYISEIARKADITGIIEVYYKILRLKERLSFNLNRAITWNYTASILKKAIVSS